MGSALGAGRVRNARVAKDRLAKFRARLGRFRILKKAKVSTARILKTGGIAAMVYGQETMGVADTSFLAQRRSAAAALSTRGCGDLDLSLAMADSRRGAKVDPAFAAHEGTIGAWAEAVWGGWLPLAMLKALMAATLDSLAGMGKATWSLVKGPAAACAMTARRLGWTTHGGLRLTTDQGEELCCLRDSPAFVRAKVRQAVVRWRNVCIEQRYPQLR